MRLFITNETGFELYAICPEEIDAEDDSAPLEFRLMLTNPGRINNCIVKELKGLPFFSKFDIPEVELGEMEIALNAPKGTTILTEDGVVPDADGTKCHMIRIRELKPKPGGN